MALRRRRESVLSPTVDAFAAVVCQSMKVMVRMVREMTCGCLKLPQPSATMNLGSIMSIITAPVKFMVAMNVRGRGPESGSPRLNLRTANAWRKMKKLRGRLR